MPKKNSILPHLLKAIISVSAPAPVREIRGAAAYARNPAKMVTPVALLGRVLPRDVKAILDVWAITRKR